MCRFKNMHSIKQMKTFCTVVEYNGFVSAQSVLGMSQPAISTHIKDFELRLGFKICERGRSGFKLTEKGEVVYEKCRSILNSMEDLSTDLKELKNTIAGVLKVGLVDSTSTNPYVNISDAVEKFYSRDNESKIHLIVLPPDDLERELLNGGLDMAIATFNGHRKGLSYVYLCQERHSLYCGRGHYLHDFERAITKQELEKLAFSIRKYFKREEVELIGCEESSAEVSNMEAQALLISSGKFVGFLPDHFAQSWVENQKIKKIVSENVEWVSDYYIATREKFEDKKIIKAFVEDLISVSVSAEC